MTGERESVSTAHGEFPVDNLRISITIYIINAEVALLLSFVGMEHLGLF